jgi:chlorite dismutase|tara:strand:- start:268 stop:1116 length:849 start_codon:yes stop_codon:yes gene_type:complete
MYFRKLKTVCLCIVFLCLTAMEAWAVQGQWGAFVYLFPKTSASMDSSTLKVLTDKIEKASSGFANDFTPQKGKTETVQFIHTVEYSLNGNPIFEKPTGLIRAESINKKTLDQYADTLSKLAGEFYRVETRFAVTRQLNYTDAATLQRLQKNAPKRGTGTEQPNTVVFPLSKTSAWWALTQEKRQSYFYENSTQFGKDHLSHNGVGFKYINRIFRKLYHSRFIDPGQDFMTYFEFSDADAEGFDALLAGLRDDKRLNREWIYVEEKPIVWGKRVATPAEMLKP